MPGSVNFFFFFFFGGGAHIKFKAYGSKRTRHKNAYNDECQHSYMLIIILIVFTNDVF